MLTILEYLVIAAVIGAVVFLIVVFVFGRGEQLAPLPPRTSPSELPDGPITGDAVRSLRLGVGMRGYRMSDVDWALDRLAAEIDRLTDELADAHDDRLPAHVGSKSPSVPASPPQPPSVQPTDTPPYPCAP